VSALILSWLDYCNSLLSNLPWSTIQSLEHVINAAARITMNLSICDHVKPSLKELHWLPVQQRITHKLCLLVHLIHIWQAPHCLIDCVCTASAAGSRYRLRSTDTADYVLPWTRTKSGERGFCYSGPAPRNSLPSDLYDLISLTLTHSKHGSRVCLSVTFVWRSWASCRVAPYKSYILFVFV